MAAARNNFNTSKQEDKRRTMVAPNASSLESASKDFEEEISSSKLLQDLSLVSVTTPSVASSCSRCAQTFTDEEFVINPCLKLSCQHSLCVKCFYSLTKGK